MTVYSATDEITYEISSISLSTYSYPFRILDDGNLSISLMPNIASSSESVIYLVNNTHYIVYGSDTQEGGNIVFTSVAKALSQFQRGYIIKIFRDVPITQENAFKSFYEFDYKKYERSIDKIAMILADQIVDEKIYFEIENPIVETAMGVIVGKDPGGYLVWDFKHHNIHTTTICDVDISVSSFWKNIVYTTYSDINFCDYIDVPQKKTSETISGNWKFQQNDTTLLSVIAEKIHGTKLKINNTVHIDEINTKLCNVKNVDFDTIVTTYSSCSTMQCKDYNTEFMYSTFGTFNKSIGSQASFEIMRVNEFGFGWDWPPDVAGRWGVYYGTTRHPSIGCVFDTELMTDQYGVNFLVDGTMEFYVNDILNYVETPNMVIQPSGVIHIPDSPYALLCELLKKPLNMHGDVQQITWSTKVIDRQNNAVPAYGTAGTGENADFVTNGGFIAYNDGLYHINCRLKFEEGKTNPFPYLYGDVGWQEGVNFWLRLYVHTPRGKEEVVTREVAAEMYRLPIQPGKIYRLMLQITTVELLKAGEKVTLFFHADRDKNFWGPYNIQIPVPISTTDAAHIGNIGHGWQSWFSFAKVG